MKRILDPGHGFNSVHVGRFELHPKGGRMRDHGNEHPLFLYVQSKERLSGDDGLAIHILAVCPNNGKILGILEFHFFGDFKSRSGRRHFPIAGRIPACLM